MEKITLEIKAAEGGTDSKLLVEDMANIYKKACQNNSFSISSEINRDGLVCL